jgi:lipoic acid synthetase
MSSPRALVREERIPEWLKLGLPDACGLSRIRSQVSAVGLDAVCFEAACPNKRVCFDDGEVAFLILGRHCTRKCKFCKVSGGPTQMPAPGEPERLKQAAAALGLKHVVITSVTRDDLVDYGAGHFAACVRSVKSLRSAPSVEVLTPDFCGSARALRTAAASGIDVFAHNLETVERLTPLVRDKACYRRSLGVLEWVRANVPEAIVKSGLLMGLGETIEEAKSTMKHLASIGCDVVTVGQYMRPSRDHIPVVRYIEPAVFGELAGYAGQMGLVPVCGPRVRSSFRARRAFHEAKRRRETCA